MDGTYGTSTHALSRTDGSLQRKDVASLGQVFTPELVVRFMLGGCWNRGRTLEPACGDGIFLKHFPSAVGIELDPRHCPEGALNIDFFSYAESEKFDTVIGNPPYVRRRDIPAATKHLLRQESFDGRSNLYLYFIEKAVRHLKDGGELVFITPRDFLKATSAIPLNRWLYKRGTITHAVELGDTRVFHDAIPNCLIWRYELGNLTHKTYCASIGYGQSLNELPEDWGLKWEQKDFLESGGHLLFSNNSYPLRLCDIASVKVGAVSGADDLFADNTNGNREFVYSATAKTGATRKMIWSNGAPHPCLLPHKDRLIGRRIRNFDDKTWWQWGRGYFVSDCPRVYVNAKTRNKNPFFLHECTHYDGSVLAIFPHNTSIDVQHFRDALNGLDWDELGFVCDGRFIFSQRSLENAPLSDACSIFLPE